MALALNILRLAIPDRDLVTRAKLLAERNTFDGRDSPASRRYISASTHYHPATECRIIYTRDTGHHSSGWWKNPDYDRCLHLSLSFCAYEGDRAYPLPFDKRMAGKWADAFFGTDVKNVWIEPPYSTVGKAVGTHHYRLFCDSAWEPIKPRGEVYSTDWTPADWKSFSDIYGDRA